MKTHIPLMVIILFVLGFATSVFAIQAEIPTDAQLVAPKKSPMITLSGEIVVSGEIRKHTADLTTNPKQTQQLQKQSQTPQREQPTASQ